MPLRIAASCPACGAPIGIDVAATAARCDRCGGAHLVLRGGETTVAEVAGTTTAQEAGELACVALADELRRRGNVGAPAVEDVLRFEAPVRIVVARLYEAAIVRSASGDPAAEVTSRVVETARTALREALALGSAPALAEVAPKLLAAVSRRSTFAPGFDASETAFGADLEGLASARGGVAPALVRRAVPVLRTRVLLLRPAFLVQLASGRSRAAVLVDSVAGQATALLSRAALEALRAALAERVLPTTPPLALRPMRCPACASAFPLDREGQLRLCPACRRAYLVTGRHLRPIAYDAELPPSPRGRLLVPAWRFAFSLTDPRDGRELDSLAAVRARCGEVGVTGLEREAPFDVPSFLSGDLRRERGGAQRLSTLPSPSHPAFEGPARGESGFPEPRLVGAIGPDEAALVVRHALLAALPPKTVSLASPRRLGALLFDAPLRLGSPKLVLRALRRDAVGPA